MIYDRLPVILLSTAASEKEGSTNQIIASYIIRHTEEVSHMGIKDLADAVHVGIASISRFCRDIGLYDFAQLKEMLREMQTSFQAEKITPAAFAEKIGRSLEQTAVSADEKKIRRLAEDIFSYPKVSTFGLLKSISAAICLQTDLRMLGKDIYTSVAYSEQMTHILRAGKDELIIIFSYTGSYFEDVSFRQAEKHLYLPRIVMFAGGDKNIPRYVDETIRFSSDLEQITHPYQLLMCESMLAQAYAEVLKA